MPKPYLIITEEGIRINSPLMNAGIIRWSDIGALTVLPMTYGDLFSIVPRKSSTLIDRQSWVQQVFLRYLNRSTGSVFRLPTLFSLIPPAELLMQIGQRYDHELHQYHVIVTGH